MHWTLQCPSKIPTLIWNNCSFSPEQANDILHSHGWFYLEKRWQVHFVTFGPPKTCYYFYPATSIHAKLTSCPPQVSLLLHMSNIWLIIRLLSLTKNWWPALSLRIRCVGVACVKHSGRGPKSEYRMGFTILFKSRCYSYDSLDMFGVMQLTNTHTDTTRWKQTFPERIYINMTSSKEDRRWLRQTSQKHVSSHVFQKRALQDVKRHFKGIENWYALHLS